MDNQGLLVIEDVVEVFATALVYLDDLALHVLGHLLDGSHGGASTAHDHHVLDIYVVFLAHDLADVGDVVARGHEVGEVVELQLVVAARDDGLASSLDGYHMVGVVGAADVLEGLVQYLASLAQLDAQHDECAVVYVPALAHPTHLQSVVDIDGGKHFGVNQLADTQFPEEILCLWVHVLRVIHLGDGSLGTELLG